MDPPEMIRPLLQITLPALVALQFAAAPFQDPVTDMGKALGSGNIQTITNLMGPTLSLFVDGQAGSFSRGQVETRLGSFFRAHPPVSFTLLHRGGGDSQYAIGTLVTRSGTFRVTFFLHRNGPSLQLEELKFQGA
ncbi:MAG TPA: DUF4783 domain-containing protein [Chitinophagaceae bacterium]|nr:DUF4783 domain-containing protein [Chitinophagaceae bacterium]